MKGANMDILNPKKSGKSIKVKISRHRQIGPMERDREFGRLINQWVSGVISYGELKTKQKGLSATATNDKQD